MKEQRPYDLDELSTLSGVAKRTVRYYIQLGLVDRPEGSTRGAFYTDRHLKQLLDANNWRRVGVSLERIKEMRESPELAGEMPAPGREPGTVEAWTHIVLADGAELVLEPHRAGLSPEQVRRLARRARELVDDVRSEGAGSGRGKE